MLEATPGKPWGIGFKDLLDVEPNMKLRYYDTIKPQSKADKKKPGERLRESIWVQVNIPSP